MAEKTTDTLPLANDGNDGVAVTGNDPTEIQQGGSRAGIVLGVIAILLVIGLGGAGFFFLQQLQKSQQGLADDLNKSEDLQLQLNRQLNNFQGDMGTLNQQFSTLNSQLASKDTELNNSTAKLERYLSDHTDLINERLQSTRSELQSGMTRIQRQLGKTRSDWLIADAEYLLSVANQRLHLIGDVNTTLLALEAADQRLSESGDPAVYPVREALADEMDSIKAIEAPDVVGIFIRLGQLQRKVYELPTYLPNSAQHVESDPETLAGQTELVVDSGFQKLNEVLATAWKDLRELVTVRRSDEPVSEIMAPEDAMLLKQGLILKLEQARTALVQRNADIYAASLDGVQVWLQRFFHMDDDETQAFAERVSELQGFTPAITYPDISGSLKKLRDITKLRIEMDKQLDESESSEEGA